MSESQDNEEIIVAELDPNHDLFEGEEEQSHGSSTAIAMDNVTESYSQSTPQMPHIQDKQSEDGHYITAALDQSMTLEASSNLQSSIAPQNNLDDSEETPIEASLLNMSKHSKL